MCYSFLLLLLYNAWWEVFKTRTLKGGGVSSLLLVFVRKWRASALFGVTEFDGNLFCIICYSTYVAVMRVCYIVCYDKKKSLFWQSKSSLLALGTTDLFHWSPSSSKLELVKLKKIGSKNVGSFLRKKACFERCTYYTHNDHAICWIMYVSCNGYIKTLEWRWYLKDRKKKNLLWPESILWRRPTSNLVIAIGGRRSLVWRKRLLFLYRWWGWQNYKSQFSIWFALMVNVLLLNPFNREQAKKIENAIPTFISTTFSPCWHMLFERCHCPM